MCNSCGDLDKSRGAPHERLTTPCECGYTRDKWRGRHRECGAAPHQSVTAPAKCQSVAKQCTGKELDAGGRQDK